MSNVRYNYKYTVDGDNNFISCYSDNLYYIDDYIHTEVTVRYQNTDNKTSQKETSKERKED